MVDTRVHYRIYGDDTVTGGVNRARLKPLHMVLVNQGHSRFVGVDSATQSFELENHELMLRDELMLGLLSDLKEAGFFDADNRATAISGDPSRYAESAGDKVQKYIAVERPGGTTVILRPKMIADPDFALFFVQCERIFLNYHAQHEPKGVTGSERRGDGYTEDDLRRYRPDPRPAGSE